MEEMDTEAQTQEVLARLLELERRLAPGPVGEVQCTADRPHIGRLTYRGRAEGYACMCGKAYQKGEGGKLREI